MNTVEYAGTESRRSVSRNNVMTGVASPDSLASFINNDASLWRSAIDELLRWKSAADTFDDDDAPDSAILDTAIDFAVDMLHERGPAPRSIVPSGNGSIAMEWRDGAVTLIVEFNEPGRATYSKFCNGRLDEVENLYRDPMSRKLELRG